MERRKFLRNTALLTGGAMVAPSVMAGRTSLKNAEGSRLVILHTNDTHSNIDPFPENHSKYPGKGGVSRRFNLVNRIRNEEEYVMLLDAGDIFQGTPYFNMFGGVLEMKVMSKLGYDAATMGNHDFDGGMDGFVAAQKYANFPFLCSNYGFSNTPIDGLTSNHVIIEKGPFKVGVFGIGIELEGLVSKMNYGETTYYNPIEIANQEAEALKAKGCNVIVCLSHLGYSYDEDRISDLKLAEKTKNIHLIIGGHTHTFLEQPVEVRNSNHEPVLVNQVGYAGINVGRVDFILEDQKMQKMNKIDVG